MTKKRMALLILAGMMLLAAVIAGAVVLSSRVGIGPPEAVLAPDMVLEDVSVSIQGAREMRSMPVYGESLLEEYLQNCSMQPVQKIREGAVYETGTVEIEICMELSGVEGMVFVLLGERDLVVREETLYELLDGNRVQEEITNLLVEQLLLSFADYTDIRVSQMPLYDAGTAPERAYEEVIGAYQWSVANFFEQCANAPEATIILTNAEGLELWAQSDMEDLLVDDGTGLNLWLQCGARDGELLQALWSWAKAQAE